LPSEAKARALGVAWSARVELVPFPDRVVGQFNLTTTPDRLVLTMVFDHGMIWPYERSRHFGVQSEMPRHPRRGPQDAEAHSRDPFRQACGRSYAPYPGGTAETLAGVHGRNDE